MATLRRILPSLVVLLVVAVVSAAPAYGCPRCKDGLSVFEQDAWFWSIVCMAFSPFIVGLSVVGVLVRASKKAAAAGIVDGR